MKMIDQLSEAKPEMFAWFNFEHADTMKVYEYLEGKGYDVKIVSYEEVEHLL